MKFGNLKFTLFFNILNSTSLMFILIVSIYLLLIDHGIYIHTTRYLLLIEESSNIAKSFIRAPTLAW